MTTRVDEDHTLQTCANDSKVVNGSDEHHRNPLKSIKIPRIRGGFDVFSDRFSRFRGLQELQSSTKTLRIGPKKPPKPACGERIAVIHKGRRLGPLSAPLLRQIPHYIELPRPIWIDRDSIELPIFYIISNYIIYVFL